MSGRLNGDKISLENLVKRFSISTPMNQSGNLVQYFKEYYQYGLNNRFHIGLHPTVGIKNPEKALEYRKIGNKHFQKNELRHALDKYAISLGIAPYKSVDYGLAVANRSAVLFKWKKYKECLQDIRTTLNSKYPEENLPKLYIREAKCFLKLHAFASAKKSLNAAHRYTTNPNIRNKLRNVDLAELIASIADLKQQIRTQSQTHTNVNVCFNDDLNLPRLKNGENPLFQDASTAVDLKYTPEKGNYVATNCDVKKGDVLFVEEPYSFQFLEDFDCPINYCVHCLKFTMNSIPCTDCIMFYYCSEECKLNHWVINHRWTCSASQLDLFSFNNYMSLNILFRASHTGFNEEIETGKFGNKDDNYPYFSTLKTNLALVQNDLVLRMTDAIYSVVYLTTFTDYFNWLRARRNRPNESIDHLVGIVGGYLLKFILQTDFNASRIRNIRFNSQLPDGLLNTDEIAAGIYVSSSHIHHFCLPNTVDSFYDSFRVVKALKDIPKGTEVTSSYLPENFMRTQSFLNIRNAFVEKYLLKCSCFLCTSPDYYKLHIYKCKKCQGPAKRDDQYAVCSQCNYKFKFRPYEQKENEYKRLPSSDSLDHNIEGLKKLESLARQIYFKESYVLLDLYKRLEYYYLFQGDLKQCLYYRKLVVTRFRNIGFEETYIFMHADYLFLLLCHCKQMRMVQSPNYERILGQVQIELERSMENLQLCCTDKFIETYRTKLNTFLSNNSPTLDIEYIYGQELEFGLSNFVLNYYYLDTT